MKIFKMTVQEPVADDLKGYCQPTTADHFHPNISFSFRFLTADDGFPISRARERKRVMDMWCRRVRTTGRERLRRFEIRF